MILKEVPCFNIIVLGDKNSGKTALIRRFYEDTFNPLENQNTGMDIIK